MRYGSVCSGIEAATVAWHHLGWEAAWYSEIEKFPSAVLAHHYPSVKNLGDMTKLEKHNGRTAIDLLVGGTPCQSFSVAGLRKGLADARGNLALVFILLLRRTRARWVLWENVPGVLSSSGGRDLASFFGGLVGREIAVPEEGWGGAGIIEPTTTEDYGIAWRVLDAQYFGVPQRRRRIFVVGYLGDWRPAAAVLLELDSLQGNPPPSREEGEGTSQCTKEGVGGSCLARDYKGIGNQDLETGRGLNDEPAAESYTPSQHGDYKEGVGTLRSNGGDLGGGSENQILGPTHSLTQRYDSSEDGSGRGVPLVPAAVKDFDCRGRGDGETAPTLCTDHASRPSDYCPIAFTHEETPKWSRDCSQSLDAQDGRRMSVATSFMWQSALGMAETEEGVGTLIKNQTPAGQRGSAVRRLTPMECERLQGFPDNYTQVPYRVKPASDGPRYKALGNSMAVPVMRWIGERIEAVNKVLTP